MKIWSHLLFNRQENGCVEKPLFFNDKEVKKDNNELEYFEKCLINSEEVIFVIYHVGKDLMSVKKLLKIYVNKHNFLK